MILHALLYRVGRQKKIGVESVFALSFHLQILHLLVPFVDWLGFAFGLPWMYELGIPAKTTDSYSNFLVMTPGIIIVWIITGYMVAKVIKQGFDITWPNIIMASLTTFLFILIPIYIIWPTFNTLFNQAFGLLVWDPQDPRVAVPRQIQWGYGTYMALTSILGLIYLSWRRRLESQFGYEKNITN